MTWMRNDHTMIILQELRRSRWHGLKSLICKGTMRSVVFVKKKRQSSDLAKEG